MMAWTTEQQVELLLRLPWTIVPEVGDELGDIVLTVREIPAAIGVGRTQREVERDLYESLATALETYLHLGHRPPLPTSVASPLPWETSVAEQTAARVRAIMTAGQVATTETTAAPVTAAIENHRPVVLERNLATA